jgi:hypothetical protein
MGALGFVMGSIASPLVGMGETFQTLAFALLAGGIGVMFATLVATSSHVRNNSCSVAA